MKYRKKPIVIEAEQWFPDHPVHGVHIDPYGITLPYIITLEGNMHVTAGDYIITGVKGEIYPCKPDIFEMTYEKVED